MPPAHISTCAVQGRTHSLREWVSPPPLIGGLVAPPEPSCPIYAGQWGSDPPLLNPTRPPISGLRPDLGGKPPSIGRPDGRPLSGPVAPYMTPIPAAEPRGGVLRSAGATVPPRRRRAWEPHAGEDQGITPGQRGCSKQVLCVSATAFRPPDACSSWTARLNPGAFARHHLTAWPRFLAGDRGACSTRRCVFDTIRRDSARRMEHVLVLRLIWLNPELLAEMC